MNDLNVGLLGFGTVGAGVAATILKNGNLMGARTGVRPVLFRIADLDITTDRGVVVPAGVLTTDAMAVINDPDVHVIVELVGGTGIAKTFVLAALNNGKPVVTANKHLLAKHGAEIFAAAEANGVDVYYEASVGGGIPCIKALREGLAANHIQAIFGILNGTCNYILTRMEDEGIAFDDVLAQAQKLGYAETDPALDVDGGDTAHKTLILASLAYGEWFDFSLVHTEGIRHLDGRDVIYAKELGYAIKLLGIIKLRGEDIEMRVHPALVPTEALLGQVSGVYNAVHVRGDIVGDTMYYGRGAGREATASAVVADLVDVGLNLLFESTQRVSGFRAHDSYNDVVQMDDVVTRYYLRFDVVDEPRVMARLTTILGDLGISIASIVQKENGGDSVPVVIVTHDAREADVKTALSEIEALDAVVAKPVLLRIEDPRR